MIWNSQAYAIHRHQMIQTSLVEMDLHLLHRVDWLFLARGATASTTAEPRKSCPQGRLNETLRHSSKLCLAA